MKCYILRWNQERNNFTKERYSQMLEDLNQNGQDFDFSWELEQWEEAEKGNMFILMQYNSDNDGIAIIGKFASDPYEIKNPKTGKKIHMVDLHILSAIDRNPESKILVTFQLEKEFPEIDWHGGIPGELIDMFVADRLSIRIMEEMMARDMWDEWTFSEFFGVKQYYLKKYS